MNHQRLVKINKIDNESYQLILFEPSDNHWYELLAFNIESLIVQAYVIYNINLSEYLN